MTGPPTPPLSSAFEIQDAARGSVPPEATVPAIAAPEPQAQPLPVAPVPPHPTLPQQESRYGLVFPALSDLAANGRYEELVRTAEEIDLIPANTAHLDRLLIITPLVLSYLILDDLPPAQHAYVRLPNTLMSHPIPQTLIRLIASVSERNYERIFLRASDVHKAVADETIPGGDLKAVAFLLLNQYIETFRQKTFILVSKAFTSIPVPLMQRYLGCSTEQARSIAHGHNWTYDTEHDVLLPVPVLLNHGAGSGEKATGQSTLATFQAIAGIALE